MYLCTVLGPKGEQVKLPTVRLTHLLFIALTISFCWLLSSCGNDDQLSGTLTNKVVRRNFASRVLATGMVTPQVGAEVRVGSRVSGKVERLMANIGNPVSRGDIIAQLENDDIEATVAQGRADLDIAKAKVISVERLYPKQIDKAASDVAKWKATVELAAKELARKQDLVKDDLAADQELDVAREQLEVSEAELEAARKTLGLTETQYEEDLKLARLLTQSARAALANAEAQLSFTIITAPISGTIASVSTQEGETVAAGFNAPTFVNIIDLGRLQVDAFVDEVDIGKIETGHQAVFTVDTYPSREFSGVVRAIRPKAVIQENVVNYVAEIEIDKPYDGVLRPEMTASITIVIENRKGILAIPVRAITRQRGRNVVWTVVGGETEMREIKVGWQEEQWIEVLEGLKEGDTVLLESPEQAR